MSVPTASGSEHKGGPRGSRPGVRIEPVMPSPTTTASRQTAASVTTRTDSGAGDRAPVTPGKSAKRIETLADCKPFTDVFRGAGARLGQLLLNQSVTARLVVLLHDDKTGTLLLADSAGRDEVVDPSSQFVMSVLSGVERAGYRCEQTFLAPPTTIAIAYNTASAKPAPKQLSKASKSVRTGGTNSDIIRFKDEILRPAMDAEASDIHIVLRNAGGESRCDVLLRVHGDLELLRSYSPDEGQALLSAIYQSEYVDDKSRQRGDALFKPDADQVGQMRVADMRNCEIRLQTNGERYGTTCVMRLLGFDGKRISDADLPALGLDEVQCDEVDLMLNRAVGVIMLVGPTGSGKSTTMAAMVRRIPDLDQQRLMSIEDPPETRFRGLSVDQLPVQRLPEEIEGKASPFARYMRTALRSDPDWIVPGEIRDADTVRLLEQAVLSGHRVLTTLHASSTLATIPRLGSREMGLSRTVMAGDDFWSGVIAQELAPVLCPYCRVPAREAKHLDGRPVLRSSAMEAIEKRFQLDVDRLYSKGAGCSHCGGRGTTGRTLVAEMLTFNASMRKALAHNDDVLLAELWRQQAEGRAFDEPWVNGRTRFEAALYKALHGVVGVDWLQRLDSFERYELFGGR